MLRDKKLLTGLGIGLIVGAILLQLMILAQDDRNVLIETENVSPTIDYSFEQLEEIANNMGYNLYAQEEKWFNQKEVDDAIRQAVEKERGGFDRTE